jgi:uncharacterized membrane protein
MKRIWMAEVGMFAAAAVLLCGIGGSFLLVPVAILSILMGAGRIGEVTVVAGVLVGTVAFGRALVLQRRRYAAQIN